MSRRESRLTQLQTVHAHSYEGRTGWCCSLHDFCTVFFLPCIARRGVVVSQRLRPLRPRPQPTDRCQDASDADGAACSLTCRAGVAVAASSWSLAHLAKGRCWDVDEGGRRAIPRALVTGRTNVGRPQANKSRAQSHGSAVQAKKHLLARCKGLSCECCPQRRRSVEHHDDSVTAHLREASLRRREWRGRLLHSETEASSAGSAEWAALPFR